jgi:steroid delta-isomerase-like uncharacterized protein
MAAGDNKHLARAVYDAFNDGDLERALAMAADDIVVELVPFDLTFQGKAGFRDFMQGFKSAFPDLRLTVVTQVATEDAVVSELTWRGTHTGPLMTPAGEIPPTGKTVQDSRFCEVWTIRDGQVTSLHNYQDAASWLRQLGLA